MKVVKFGGSSLANATQLKKVKEIVKKTMRENTSLFLRLERVWETITRLLTF